MTETTAGIAAIDVETATKRYGSICEIGVAVQHDSGILAQAWDVRPPDNIFIDEFTALHHISGDDRADAPDFNDIWPEVRSMISGRIPICHNAEFDAAHINTALARAWSPDVFGPAACTLRMARLLWPSRTRPFSLVSLCEDNDIPLGENAHSARHDAAATLRIAELLMVDWHLVGSGRLMDLIVASDSPYEREPITDRQANYLASLAKGHGLNDQGLLMRADNKSRASLAIEILKSQPLDRIALDAVLQPALRV